MRDLATDTADGVAYQDGVFDAVLQLQLVRSDKRNLRALLLAMLTPEPDRRLSAAQALAGFHVLQWRQAEDS